MFASTPPPRAAGTVIALTIIALWLVHGAVLLEGRVLATARPITIAMHVVIQAYLSTGLFITAHDAMHRTVSRSRRLNDAVGTLACFLFAGMSYRRLLVNHARHHAAPGTEGDPDFARSPRFAIWFLTFMVHYTTITQLVVMAVLFNVLKLRYDEPSLAVFWIAPSLMASVQLFFFGTYLPHRTPHTEAMKPHNARSLPRNDVLAMLSCYFFGYHSEHHASPGTPWWRLASLKRRGARMPVAAD